MTKTLWRPVGQKELQLIKNSNFTAFPPRLQQQPIFYPVCNREYAQEISKKWNVDYCGKGYVLEFEVDEEYISGYKTHIVGSKKHEEYWIPAEDLNEFNKNIVGEIRVVDEYE